MDVGDWTLLQVAAQTNENHVVNLLLNSGADSNIPIENNVTSLHLAVQHGYIDGF